MGDPQRHEGQRHGYVTCFKGSFICIFESLATVTKLDAYLLSVNYLWNWLELRLQHLSTLVSRLLSVLVHLQCWFKQNAFLLCTKEKMEEGHKGSPVICLYVDHQELTIEKGIFWSFLPVSRRKAPFLEPE